MFWRLSVTTALGIATATAMITAGMDGGQITRTSIEVPLAGHGVVSAVPAPKKCPANFASGTVGGQSKCLAAGQQCQQAHAVDYSHYGFNCGKVGTRYQLSKPTPGRPVTAKAATAKPATPKPAVSKTHR